MPTITRICHICVSVTVGVSVNMSVSVCFLRLRVLFVVAAVRACYVIVRSYVLQTVNCVFVNRPSSQLEPQTIPMTVRYAQDVWVIGVPSQCSDYQIISRSYLKEKEANC